MSFLISALNSRGALGGGRWRSLSCPSYCNDDAEPVCGSDGVLYKNDCDRRKRTCGTGNTLNLQTFLLPSSILIFPPKKLCLPIMVKYMVIFIRKEPSLAVKYTPCLTWEKNKEEKLLPGCEKCLWPICDFTRYFTLVFGGKIKMEGRGREK